MDHNLDLQILMHFNWLLPSSGVWREIFEDIGNNALIRGFPVFVPLLVLWHSSDNPARRSRMLAGFVAACVATVLSLQIQHHLHTHIRPFMDLALHLPKVGSDVPLTWDHPYSFPSDTATLFCSLAMVVFLENKFAGTVAFLWSLISVGVIRVALGWHYPSDIAGGLILGPACVLLFERSDWLGGMLARLLQRYQSRSYIVHAAVFLFLADAYWLFQGLQGVCRLFQMSGRDLMTRL